MNPETLNTVGHCLIAVPFVLLGIVIMMALVSECNPIAAVVIVVATVAFITGVFIVSMFAPEKETPTCKCIIESH